MKIKHKQITTTISHPMEEHFNLPENSTVDTYTERETELVKTIEYDEKDDEIEEAYQEIYDKAITGYEHLSEEMEVTDPKYLARLGEVSVTFLKAALDAANKKGDLKAHKDKLRARSNSPKNVTNNQTIVMSREQLLETFMNNSKTKAADTKQIDVIDVQHKQIGKSDEESN